MTTIWKITDLTELNSLIESQSIKNNLSLSIYNDINFNEEKTRNNPSSIITLVGEQNSKLIGYAIFLVETWDLKFQIGEVVLYKKNIRRLHNVSAPTLINSLNEDSQKEALTTFIEFIKHNIADEYYFYFEGIKKKSEFYNLLDNKNLRPLGLRSALYGKEFEHHIAKFPKTFKEYLQNFSSKSRKKFRYMDKKLKEHANNVHVRKYTDSNDIDEFVDLAHSVSKETYQWHLLGLGLREPENLKKQYKAYANKGWFRSYILMCNDKAVSFLIGYQHDQTYYYIDVGHLPDWSKWSPGTLLLLSTIEDLFADDLKYSYMDFSTGTGDLKSRFGNQHILEANILVSGNLIGSRLTISTYQKFEAFAQSIVHIADKLQIKSALKKFWRARSTK